MDKLFFLNGLPRSGSTLLANILAQNPDIHTTGTSGLLAMLAMIKNTWNDQQEHMAMPELSSEAAKNRVLSAMIQSYHSTGRPIVIDKSRGWVAHMEMLSQILPHEVKVLVTVRDMRDILASWEMLYRKKSATAQWPGERENYVMYQSVSGRLQLWMQPDHPIGLSWRRVVDARSVRGFRKNIFMVRFEELTTQPAAIMAGIYAFLGLEPFEHDFDNVKQYTQEDDRVYGMGDLHKIRAKVEPVEPRWPSVLGDIANKYKVDW